MRPPRLSRRTAIVLIVAGTILAVLAGIGIYGLLRGPAPTPQPAVTPTASAPAAAPLPEVTPSSDAVVFARRVAVVLFDWDTTAASSPSRIIDALLEVGDPSGEDIPGLRADAATYLPTTAQWSLLGDYRTTQRLQIDTAAVPESWKRLAAEQSLPEGIVAVTIDGTRIRSGGWSGVPTVQEYPVAFTVFLTCPPATDSCRLLRLSVLDTPLR